MTTDESSPSRAELLDALHTSGRRVLQRIRTIDPALLEEGRYEGGWNGRQILAHMASIEWTYPRILDLPEGDENAIAATGDSQGASQSNPMDGYNERQVAQRAEASIADLLAEFEANRAKTIAAVETVEPAVLERRVVTAGGRTGTIAQVLNDVAVRHVLGHLEDLSPR